MYPIGTRVIIIKGFFCSKEAYEMAEKKGIKNYKPSGTVVYSNTLEHRVKLDQSIFPNPLVTMLLIGDLQIITPKNIKKKLNTTLNESIIKVLK